MFDSSIRAVESVASSNTQNVINCVNTHDVDEDKVAIIDYGGCWWEQSFVGVMDRFMDCDPFVVAHNVALMKKKIKTSSPLMGC